MFSLQSSLYAISALGSHSRIDIGEAAQMIEERRVDLVMSAFPYMSQTDEKPKTRKQTYEELFDELDEIIDKEKHDASGESNSEDKVEP